MVFITEGFFEVAIESYRVGFEPTTTEFRIYIYIYINVYIYICTYIYIYIYIY